MNWTTVTNGRHAGKTLPQIVFADPAYFFTSFPSHLAHGEFGNNKWLEIQAKALDYKTRHIRIPMPGMVTQYGFYLGDTPFCVMHLVHEGDAPDQELKFPIVKSVIDLSVPGEYPFHEKRYYKDILFFAKNVLFGNGNTHMQKSQAEDFFENDDNFVFDQKMRQWFDTVFLPASKECDNGPSQQQ